ncbi:MAG: hypothetical protein ABIZ52_08560 [Candidatus Limnocylindrales bacterium]
MATDPDAALARARANVRHMRSAHGSRTPWLDRWEAILQQGPDHVMRALVAETEESADLRQSSPFAGVLTDRQRSHALAAFRKFERGRTG